MTASGHQPNGGTLAVVRRPATNARAKPCQRTFRAPSSTIDTGGERSGQQELVGLVTWKP